MSDPSPQALELAANCVLTNRGTDWGPIPLWEADLTKELNATIDFAAAGNHEESRNADVTRAFAAALHDAAKDLLKTAEKQLDKVKALATPDALTKLEMSAAEGMGHEYLDIQQSLLEGIGARPRAADAA